MLAFRYFHTLSVNPIVIKIISASFVIGIALITIILSAIYDPSKGWMASLNSIMSGRLYYSHRALEEFGISLFGQKVSFGAVSNYSLITGEWIERYEELILDSSYVRIPINCGAVFFAVNLLAISCANLKLAEAGQYRLLALIAIAAVYGVMENNASLLFYNSLLFLMATPLVQSKDIYEHVCSISGKGERT